MPCGKAFPPIPPAGLADRGAYGRPKGPRPQERPHTAGTCPEAIKKGAFPFRGKLRPCG